MNNSPDKKLKHKSFLMRAQERTDYKVQPSKMLDMLAGAISVIAAALVWLYI
jgi:hypothetical protein